MATRLYAQRQQTFTPSPTSFTPSVQGTWDSDFSVVYPMNVTATAVADSSYLTRTVTTAASAATIVHAIWVSPPMQSTHAWGSATATWETRCQEASTTQNVFQQFYWGVLSNSGSLQAISNLEKGATEFPTTLISRFRTDAASGMSYTNIPGDRLFVEVGWDKDAAVSGDVSIQYGYSDTAGDLTGDGDTGVQNGWFEVSENVTFDAEGTVYGKSRLMLLGVG